MIITIEGMSGTGKTTLARDMCKNRNSLFIRESELRNERWTNQISADTDIIVIDDVRNYEKTRDSIKKIFIARNNQYIQPFYKNSIDIVLCRTR